MKNPVKLSKKAYAAVLATAGAANKLGEINQNLLDLKNDVAFLHRRVLALANKLDVYERQLCRQDGESEAEAIGRLLKNLPPATGHLALRQQVNARLLADLHALCWQTGVEYWLWAGSAVGASVRGGVLPWDDDIDICMMRADFEKLCVAVNARTDYCVTTVNDYFSHNVQHRFCSRDPQIRNFIDIVVCDWAREPGLVAEAAYFDLAKAIRKEWDEAPELAYWRKNLYITTPGEPEVTNREQPPDPDPAPNPRAEMQNRTKINQILTKYYRKATKSGLLCAEKAAGAVAYGLENLWEQRETRALIWPRDLIFPLVEVPFDAGTVLIAHDNTEFCRRLFPAFPYIPNDIGMHAHLQEAATFAGQAAMQQFLSQKPVDRKDAKPHAQK